MENTEKEIYNLWERMIEDIPDKYLFKYIKDNLDYTPNDDIEPSVEEAYDFDLIDELKDRGYDFSKEIDVDDAIDIVEKNGYVVLENDIVDNRLDIIDSRRLEEIENLFMRGSWSEREEMYNKLFGG